MMMQAHPVKMASMPKFMAWMVGRLHDREEDMDSVTSFLRAEDVLLDLAAKSKQALLEAVGLFLHEHRGIDAADVTARLAAREELGSTGLGQGVAIPHARFEGLKEPQAVFARLQNPIDFDAPDDSPVRFCFVLLVPAKATELHLQILAHVAEMLSDSALRAKLDEAKTADEVYRLLGGYRGSNE
jgi:PTS system nitrogen regulatory IIA component